MTKGSTQDSGESRDHSLVPEICIANIFPQQCTLFENLNTVYN
jgi:hypothetical protein